MALDIGGGSSTKKTNKNRKTAEDRVAQGTPTPGLDVYGGGYTTGYVNLDDPFLTNTGGLPANSPTQAPDPYTTATGVTSDYVGNQFLDNPTAAVNNIMQGLGLSVSSNSPFYNTMAQLAPGLEWLQYFGTGTGQPGSFLGNVGDWFTGGTQGIGNAFGSGSVLSNALNNLVSGGNNADLSAMIDNMTPEDLTRAIISMMNTGMYGSAGSRVREGLQARAADVYNQFIGNQPTIEAGLGAGQTIADAYLNFLRENGLLTQLGF